MSTLKRIIKVLIVLTLLAGILFPFYWMVITSFKTAPEINASPPVFWPAHFNFASYAQVLKDLPIGRLMLNTIIVSSVITISTLFTASLAGYIFEKFRSRSTEIIFWGIIGTMMIPFPVIMIPVYMLFRDLKLINTLAGIIVPSLAGPFATFFMRQYMKNIPNEMLDAARMDGASELSIFMGIVLPNCVMALTALGIFEFMASWDDFLWPLLIIEDNEKRTLVVGLAMYRQSFGPLSANLIMAGSIMAMLPILILFIIGRRNFMQGMTLSGFKG